MADATDTSADFAQFSAEFANLYASARRMVWVAPRQTLIDLLACGAVLAHHVLGGCSYDRDVDFGGLLKLPALRRLPVARHVHLDWLRKKGNIAAHPEDAAPNVAYDRLAQEGLKYAHGLAVGACPEPHVHGWRSACPRRTARPNPGRRGRSPVCR